MREFTTAVETMNDPLDGAMEFKVDGQTLHCFKPGDGQLAMLMASLGRHTNQQTRVAGIIDFFVAVMDEASADYLVERLLSRKDKFGLTEVQEIMEWMIEEWSARPTQSPSGSTESPPNGGQRLTVSTTGQTSSDSPQTVS